jgi:SSS family solute:Na+ symporter
VAHYALRPWPWILVALCSLIVYPQLDDIRHTFPHVDPRLVGHDMAYPAMLRFLPAGWLGLMVAGLLAAYVSTIATHLNWGTSYVVHDLYRRFLRPGATERHYVAAGRWVTALLMLLAAAMTLVLENARQGFELMMSVGAGTGLLYLLRWFWWRINAWSEVAAMISSFTVAVGFFVAARAGHGVPSHIALICTVAVTTVVWVATAYLAPQTARSTLISFYRLVRPAGPGWARVRVGAGLPRQESPGEADQLSSPDNMPRALLGWTLGCAFTYAALFGAGSFLYGHTAQAALWLALFVVSGFGLLRLLPRLAARS